jgi:hypothetical protein
MQLVEAFQSTALGRSAIQSHHRVILWVQGYRPALLSQTSNYLSGQTITFLAQKSWSITHTCPKRGWYNNPSPPEASAAGRVLRGTHEARNLREGSYLTNNHREYLRTQFTYTHPRSESLYLIIYREIGL